MEVMLVFVFLAMDLGEDMLVSIDLGTFFDRIIGY
jgi:hypothetical protein